MKLSHNKPDIFQGFATSHAREWPYQGFLKNESLFYDRIPKESILIFLSLMGVLLFSCDTSLSFNRNSKKMVDNTQVYYPNSVEAELEELQESKQEAILFFKQNRVLIYALRNVHPKIIDRNQLSFNLRANELELRNNNVMLGILKFQPTSFDELHNLKVEYMQELEDVHFATRVMLIESK